MTPNSRSYLTQFTQPDTIIPDPYNPLSWNRYSYVRYNPINFNDPTGHSEACAQGDDCHYNKEVTVEDYINVVENEYNITISPLGENHDWNIIQVKTIFRALVIMEKGLDKLTKGAGKEWILKNLSGASFTLNGVSSGMGSFVLGTTVILPATFATDPWANSIDQSVESMLIHELGHVWDNNSRSGLGDATFFGGGHADFLSEFMGGDPTGLRWTGGVNVPGPNRFPADQGPDYGNNSSADYFAHTFVGAIVGSNAVPQVAKMWISAVINLSK